MNALRGRVTILFITHQLPKSLRFDTVYELGRGPQDDKRLDVIRGGEAPPAPEVKPE